VPLCSLYGLHPLPSTEESIRICSVRECLSVADPTALRPLTLFASLGLTRGSCSRACTTGQVLRLNRIVKWGPASL